MLTSVPFAKMFQTTGAEYIHSAFATFELTTGFHSLGEARVIDWFERSPILILLV
jgi:hypothetical protein